MTLEDPRAPEPGFGSLQSCLVEGDPQSEKRARRIKRRAVAVSIALQTLALAALVLFPLLSKGERISPPNFTPIPPYAPAGVHPHTAASESGRHAPPPCHICQPRSIPPTIATTLSGQSRDEGGPDDNLIPGAPSGEAVPGGLNPPNTSRPVPPPPDNPPPVKQRYQVSELQQMAQLVTRIEPIYPPLAVQIHREGRVELHAIIATDGSIQSLEVVSGDPFFIQSAVSAVRQWRYRPTILSGRPIEVDTHITVIYTLSH
ncbi:MAG TPA: energy transducer TonB [Terriglobales bacterium]|nr:energy transducer TonB [Terriglobales bacterium]